MVCAGWAVEGEKRSSFGGLPVDSRVRESVHMAEDHPVCRDSMRVAQQVQHVQGGGSTFEVDADGRVGGVVCLSRGRDDVSGVVVEVVVGAGDLDHPCCRLCAS
ncbi:hypothetical protein AOZ06_27120 [Kibdelosporangium phytohabitans]|uniref:Uncharacterized protein n=1 Tax=Kibdelosporangium phytohabitans TaxID=860235 RepID=A0A0N9I356_9PSEU|nr:hypothetical protein AOZ06_27120 [Kibdelosporangium phytohabitans]